MVSGVKGFVVENGEGAGGESADKEGAEEAWSVGDGDSVDIVPGAVCIFQSLIDNRENSFEMRAGGDFWDDASVFGKNIDLGDNDITQNFSTVLYNRGGGFVAAGFDT